MAYSNYNPNPSGRSVGDCVIRAAAKAEGISWEDAYATLAAEGFAARDLPNADHVWGGWLRKRGWRRRMIPEDAPAGYTVADFAADHPRGLFVLSMPGRHVVAMADGDWYDSWDSGAEVPAYYYEKGGER